MRAPSTKTIAIIAMPSVQLLDVSGPLDVFAQANTETNRIAYRLLVVGRSRAHIRSSSGVRIVPDIAINEQPQEKFDTLLIAGSPSAATDRPDRATVQWIRDWAPTMRRYGSVCGGAFLLAATGLLDGKRITTHWAVSDRFRAAFPKVSVDDDAIYVRDGRVRTAAGVTAGLDLALSLVEEDLGSEIAKDVAAQLVMFFKRPGGQTQFSRASRAQPAGRSALQEVQRWVAANPSGDNSIAKLSERMNLSPRHFSRLFRSEVGMTPKAWVEASRIAAARGLLENGRSSPKEVAARCGFSDADTLRRAFMPQVGVSPAEYRRRFSHIAD